jgi:uncharacterized membrane protein
MNPSQIHLALTHVPVILSITGLIMLIISLVIKNDTVTKTSYYILLLAGFAAIPVFFTGEDTEEIVEKLPGVSENIIGKHEGVANIALATVLVGAALSLVGLLFYGRSFTKTFKIVVLLIASVTGVAMFQTARLGGKIRHTEARAGFTTQNEKGISNSSSENGENKEKD